MNPDVIGLNTEKIDKFVLDSYDIVEKINNVLNNIATEVNNTKEFFVGETGDEFRNKFQEQKDEFGNLSANLLRYLELLVEAKSKSTITSQNISEKVKSDSKDVNIIHPYNDLR